MKFISVISCRLVVDIISVLFGVQLRFYVTDFSFHGISRIDMGTKSSKMDKIAKIGGSFFSLSLTLICVLKTHREIGLLFAVA